MAIYNVNPDIQNFLKRGFVAPGSKKESLDAFQIVQDPTFLSFTVEFFYPEYVSRPNDGTSIMDYMTADQFLVHNFSHEGLLLPPRYNIDTFANDAVLSQNDASNGQIPNNPGYVNVNTPADYSLADSAEDYLYAIGSVNRVGHLRSFKQFLYKLQSETPWYFQRINGAEDLYKINPGVNTKKDALLTFECLESVDMRMSLLADMYRMAAFDFEHHREVLPYNLRTFKMRIHVLEMRKFNSTYGVIASLLGGKTDAQFQNAGSPVDSSVDSSVFDTISVQTYELGMCEFDFFNTSPGYLDNLAVDDVPQATYKFGIKYGTVRKSAKYPFYQYVSDHVIAKSMFPLTQKGDFGVSSLNLGNPSVTPYYDPYSTAGTLTNYDPSLLNSFTGNLSKFQVSSAENSVINDIKSGRVLGSLESIANTAVINLESRINSGLLENVYKPSLLEAANALGGFLGGGAIPSFQQGAVSQPVYNPGKENFDSLPVDKKISGENGFSSLPNTDKNITGNGFDSLPVSTNIQEDPLQPAAHNDVISPVSEQFSTPPSQPSISPKNVFKQS